MNSLEQSNATFVCNIQSEPTHITDWYFNGMPLNSSSKYVITGRGTASSSLSITGVVYADSGDYTCVATNEHGTTNATGRLTVQG